jgi:spore germination protein GerM
LSHTLILVDFHKNKSLTELAERRFSSYYVCVADRKSGGSRTGKPGASKKKERTRKIPWGVIFWTAFFVIVTGLFLVNRETIKNTLRSTRFLDRLTRKETGPAETPAEAPRPQDGEENSAQDTGQKPSPSNPPAETRAARPKDAQVTENPKAPAEDRQADSKPAPEAGPSRAAPKENSAQQTPPRERIIYLTRVDKEGILLRSQVTRRIPSSDSPMLDALKALLQGPAADEKNKGYLSLIPQGSRVLAATVRGSTAYISFSEEFQYNTFGVEGYAAQLKEVVWTATEFPNVKDVQILIEGRRVDYLGESVWIGSPIGRDSM